MAQALLGSPSGRRYSTITSFDALRYRGPGTDLTIGLLPASKWLAAEDESRGIKHIANMPTEEVFTSPDARRTEGIVRATYPLQLQGNVIRGLTIRFEETRAVEVCADRELRTVRAHIASDEGAGRLGEAALVDRSSRVGQTGVVFYDTLFDEERGLPRRFGCRDRPVRRRRRSPVRRGAGRGSSHQQQSSLHTDFMIGSPEVDVWGVRKTGDEIPILRDGAQLGPLLTPDSGSANSAARAYMIHRRDVAQPG